MKTKLKLLAIMFSILIISLPICFATELNYIYDANGNLVTGDGKYREYNSLNQLAKIYNGTNSSGTLLEEYSYHPTEERIYKKKVYNSDASLKETVIYASKTFVKVINSSGEYNYTYVSLNGQLIAQNQDGNKYFISEDHKGTTSVVTNSTGQVIENSSYDPFGAPLTQTNQRFGYEGKEFSSVIGDIDFNFRKYDPSRGQFIQPDTLIQNMYDPQSLNRYSFERNNPLKNTDQSGHEFTSIFVAIMVVSLLIYLLTFADTIQISKDSEKNINDLKLSSYINPSHQEMTQNTLSALNKDEPESVLEAITRGAKEKSKMPKIMQGGEKNLIKNVNKNLPQDRKTTQPTMSSRQQTTSFSVTGVGVIGGVIWVSSTAKIGSPCGSGCVVGSKQKN